MGVERSGQGDFASFYRAYARTGIHAAAAALLTLFGLLAAVAEHWAFVAVGVAAYVLPPAFLYATGNHPGREATNVDTEASTGDEASDAGSAPEREGADGERGGTSVEGDEVNAGPEGDESSPESPGVERKGTGGEPEATEGDREKARKVDREEARDEDATHAASASTDDARGTGDWRWRPTSPPTDVDLADATAAADGVYVAGAGGVLLARRDGEWETTIEDGAGGDGNDFTAVDATSDGRATWAVGDGGAVARYEVDAERTEDRSAPNDLTSTWTGVAVAGAAGEETVYLANGSGVVLRGVLTDGDVTWGEGEKPGSGSSVADLAFPTPRRGVVCDTAGDVLETTDGDSFDRIGVDDPGGTLTAVVAGDGAASAEAAGNAGDESDDGLRATVADDDGGLYRRNRADWTRDRPTDAGLFGLAAGDGERLAVGAEGTVLADRGDGWKTGAAPVDATLRGVALPGDGPALAVGDGGAAVERRPTDADG